MRHGSQLLASAAMPRGLSRVFAMAGPAPTMADVMAKIEPFIARHNERYETIEAELNDHATRLAGIQLNGGGGRSSSRPDDPEYTNIFASYFRTGQGEDSIRAANATGQRAQINASMSEGSNPDGGYLAPTEWDRRISEAQVATSPMRQLATVRPTSVGAYSTIWNNNQWGSGWVGETASRPQTSTSNLSPILFPTGEIYAMPAVTQRILDDAMIDLPTWIAGQIETEFNRQEGIAFVSGDGVNKPAGFLTYITGAANAATHPGGVLDVIPTGVAAALGSVDNLIDFTYGLAAPYRAKASWLMNSLTAAALTKMKNSDGDLIWRESLIVGQPATLLGRPVVLDENMPNIAAGTLPIAFGDFRTGYVINDRIGVRILRDPYSAKPFVLLYTTKRVGGGVADPRAIRLLKIAVS